jgi:NTE family protein
LALGGGGARGLGHIPVLEALDDLGLRPAAIAGTSIGGVIGAGYAAGMSGHDIRAFCLDTFRNRAEVLSRLWRIRPKPIGGLFAEGAVLTQFDAERLLGEFLPATLPKTFADLAIPLTLVATDFYGWQEALIEEGPLVKALAASAALPAVFRPVPHEGRVMIDGGVTNPLPFDHVGEGMDLVIAVDVLGGPTRRHHRLPSSSEAVFGATQIFMRAITSEKLKHCRPPDILVRPPPNPFRVLDFLKAAAILRAAEPVRDDVKRALDRVLAA